MKRIDILPDDVLLGIFDFYVNDRPSYENKIGTEKWQLLIHVCRRWRTLVLASPRRLNLQLFCTPDTPASDTLDVWPALPLIIRGVMGLNMDNIIAALKGSNRVCQVDLTFEGWQLENVLVAMQVPFPELTELRLRVFTCGETIPVIPDLFFDRSAPHLRHIILRGIPFPGLPNLLLSATHLVDLNLDNIPHSGYISPEEIVALISVLSSIETLSFGFQSPQSRPDPITRRLPPSNRSVIPTLRNLGFKGVVEYIEDLVTGIDAPQLDKLEITVFNQIDFDTPRLAQFINRTPKLGKREAIVQFTDSWSRIQLGLPQLPLPPGTFQIGISCREPDWQLSSIEQVCNSSLHPLSTVEDLYIEHWYLKLVWKDDAIENTLWLQLLLPFTTVKNLYLYEEFAPGIAAALKELDGGRITEVLPSLRNIFVKGLEPSGPFQEKIGQFVAARELSDRPITISDWDGRRW